MSKEYTPDYQMASEFEADPDCYVLFASHGLNMGRMIAENKGTYCVEHQGELVIFNANVLTKKHGKIWYGDLNVNNDFEKLKDIADKMGEDLYILVEGDARFGYENRNIKLLLSKAKAVIKCNEKLKKKKSEKN
jgi:hypothetical protein